MERAIRFSRHLFAYVVLNPSEDTKQVHEMRGRGKQIFLFNINSDVHIYTHTSAQGKLFHIGI